MSGGSSVDLAKIFVGGLSWQTEEDALRYHFEQFGEVATVEVMRDRNTNQVRRLHPTCIVDRWLSRQ